MQCEKCGKMVRGRPAPSGMCKDCRDKMDGKKMPGKMK